MKQVLLTLLCCTLLLQSRAQTAPEPRFDERIELLTIVNRHIPAAEFTNEVAKYGEKVDTWFKPYQDHPAVILASELRHDYDISYDAVICFALCLEIGHDVTLNEELAARNLDERWTLDNARRMTRALNTFYHDSRFHDFFLQSQDTYQAAANAFRPILAEVDFSWFPAFYGEQGTGQYHLVLSLLNWGSYGPSLTYPDGHTDLYAVMGAGAVDPGGMPLYGESERKTIIHEYNHPFCNPRMDALFPGLGKQAAKAYALVEEWMERQAYGKPDIMMREIMVRTAELRYARAQGADAETINKAIEEEKARGFFWIEDLYQLFDQYEANRSTYPTLDSFMSVVASYHQGKAFRRAIKALRREKKSWPKITSTSIANNSRTINPGATTLIIRFDQPMDKGFNGLAPGTLGIEGIPHITGAQWNDTNPREWTIEMELAPGRTYSIRFNSHHFRSAETQKPLRESLTLEFRTKEG